MCERERERMCVSVCMCVCTRAPVYARVYVCVCACACKCLHMCACKHACVCTQSRMGGGALLLYNILILISFEEWRRQTNIFILGGVGGRCCYYISLHYHWPRPVCTLKHSNSNFTEYNMIHYNPTTATPTT